MLSIEKRDLPIEIQIWDEMITPLSMLAYELEDYSNSIQLFENLDLFVKKLYNINEIKVDWEFKIDKPKDGSEISNFTAYITNHILRSWEYLFTKVDKEEIEKEEWPSERIFTFPKAFQVPLFDVKVMSPVIDKENFLKANNMNDLMTFIFSRLPSVHMDNINIFNLQTISWNEPSGKINNKTELIKSSIQLSHELSFKGIFKREDNNILLLRNYLSTVSNGRFPEMSRDEFDKLTKIYLDLVKKVNPEIHKILKEKYNW